MLVEERGCTVQRHERRTGGEQSRRGRTRIAASARCHNVENEGNREKLLTSEANAPFSFKQTSLLADSASRILSPLACESAAGASQCAGGKTLCKRARRGDLSEFGVTFLSKGEKVFPLFYVSWISVSPQISASSLLLLSDSSLSGFARRLTENRRRAEDLLLLSVSLASSPMLPFFPCGLAGVPAVAARRCLSTRRATKRRLSAGLVFPFYAFLRLSSSFSRLSL
ncbi:hypothetical protein TGMAS_292325 [Toxoplasma gondii MAS]|uniref:Uncharacterized protein n=1 Tax=Toxoplasma gondii MAS TaxID=943118 RepID=A0A086PZI7_TOXGO|nr:hypothetical protein TGMAS_292325 [Toxoplasma gondii MAS]